MYCRLGVASAAVTLAMVPAPSDAIRVDGWIQYDDNDWRRQFMSTDKHTVPGMDDGDHIDVSVRGEQVQTGDVLRRYAYVAGTGAFSAAQLRQLAAECLNAADTLDDLDG